MFSQPTASTDGSSIEETVVRLLTERHLWLATAESCTGGLIADKITNVSGASAVFRQGYITYANEAKTELLGVPGDLIREQGAVSEPVARLMAEGALQRAGVDHALAVTGIAGPTGGTPEKPAGTVFMAQAARHQTTFVRCSTFALDRRSFKERTAHGLGAPPPADSGPGHGGVMVTSPATNASGQEFPNGSAMKFPCPHCAGRIEATEAWFGHSVPCPHCGTPIQVPGPADTPTPEPPELPASGSTTKPVRHLRWGIIIAVGAIVVAFTVLGPSCPPSFRAPRLRTPPRIAMPAKVSSRPWGDGALSPQILAPGHLVPPGGFVPWIELPSGNSAWPTEKANSSSWSAWGFRPATSFPQKRDTPP